MGFNSSYSGAITFSRPLTYAEIKDSRFLVLPDAPCWDRCGPEEPELHFALNVVTEVSATGVQQTITAWGVEADDEIRSHYEIEDQLRELVASVPGDVYFGGYLDATGDEATRWRLYATRWGSEARVTEVRPRLVWPLSDAGLGDDEIETAEGQP